MQLAIVTSPADSAFDHAKVILEVSILVFSRGAVVLGFLVGRKAVLIQDPDTAGHSADGEGKLALDHRVGLRRRRGDL